MVSLFKMKVTFTGTAWKFHNKADILWNGNFSWKWICFSCFFLSPRTTWVQKSRSPSFASLQTEPSFLAPGTFPKLPNSSSYYSFRGQEDLCLLQSAGQAAVHSPFLQPKFLLQFQYNALFTSSHFYNLLCNALTQKVQECISTGWTGP